MSRPTTGLRRVIIESPYSGDVVANTAYLDRCFLDALSRGEAPIASHGSRLVHVLNDHDAHQRRQGMDAGLAWYAGAELIAFYVDRGMTTGMVEALEYAIKLGIKFELRRLDLPDG